MVSTSRSKTFLNIGLPLMAIIKRTISIPLKRKSVATGRNKEFVYNIFPRLDNERIGYLKRKDI